MRWHFPKNPNTWSSRIDGFNPIPRIWWKRRTPGFLGRIWILRLSLNFAKLDHFLFIKRSFENTANPQVEIHQSSPWSSQWIPPPSRSQTGEKLSFGKNDISPRTIILFQIDHISPTWISFKKRVITFLGLPCLGKSHHKLTKSIWDFLGVTSHVGDSYQESLASIHGGKTSQVLLFYKTCWIITCPK